MFREFNNTSLQEQKGTHSKLVDEMNKMKENINELNNSLVQMVKALSEQSKSIKRLEQSRNDVDQIREQVQNIETNPSDAIIRYIQAQFEQYNRQQHEENNQQVAQTSIISNKELSDLRTDLTTLIQSSIQQQEATVKQMNSIKNLSLKVEKNEETMRAQSNGLEQILHFEGLIAELIARMDHTDNKIVSIADMENKLEKKMNEQCQKEVNLNLSAIASNIEKLQKEFKSQLSSQNKKISKLDEQNLEIQLQLAPKPARDRKALAEINQLQNQIKQAMEESMEKQKELEILKGQNSQNSLEISEVKQLIEKLQKQIQKPDQIIHSNEIDANSNQSKMYAKTSELMDQNHIIDGAQASQQNQVQYNNRDRQSIQLEERKESKIKNNKMNDNNNHDEDFDN